MGERPVDFPCPRCGHTDRIHRFDGCVEVIDQNKTVRSGLRWCPCPMKPLEIARQAEALGLVG